MALELTPEKRYGYLRLIGLVLPQYTEAGLLLGATFVITQSFLYNAILLHAYALVLTESTT